ncbi:two-component system sensor histidine kinase CreC [Persicirhabdus sediminis]|uniref:histidine kinase n=1 Tax=Persicirhabdus sediminis TaxID=454144 RepID=A0A8J7MAS6_9BACT|nr:two-component system sensor histidine kinase CreC [Persicirhabdus sediminis]MBK1789561.1 two-component system sensor histidine kinase CreC [Persicirhabdus sediminis]
MRLTRVTLFIIVLIISFGFYQVLSYLLEDVEAQAFKASEEVMVDTAHLLAGVVEAELKKTSTLDGEQLEMQPAIDLLAVAVGKANAHEIDAKIYRHMKVKLGLNVYLTNLQGLVVYDSAGGMRVGMDYSEYNDVYKTIRGEYGARSSRDDENLKTSSVLYVAAPVNCEGELVAVLTIYKNQSDLKAFIDERRRDIVFSTLMIGVGVVLLTVAVLIWVYRPVGILTKYAQAVSEGERLPLPQLGSGREVNTLGRALYQMRETLEGRRYVENYVTSLTHELKSPLAGIKGAAELLNEDMPQEMRQKFIANISREVERGEILVRDLLYLSQLEGMHHLEKREMISASDMCRQVLAEHEVNLQRADVTASLEIDGDRDALRVLGDGMVLKMALANLFENAIGFSPAGANVEVHVAISKRGERWLDIEVIDYGPGIPEYAQRKVFEHFYSLPRPSGRAKGTGLGLPLVKEAAKLHGGTARLENRFVYGDDGKALVVGCRALVVLPRVV